MTESKARSDEDETNSSLEQPVSRKAQRRSARTLIMLRTRTKQQCKGHKHRAESCMSQYTSGVCSCQRFLSSAAHSSSEEHPDREPAAEISEAASLSSEELPMNTEVQNFSPWQSDGHHEDNERVRKHHAFHTFITILLLLTVLVLVSNVTCTVRQWCF